jgi:hypothetical protein
MLRKVEQGKVRELSTGILLALPLSVPERKQVRGKLGVPSPFSLNFPIHVYGMIIVYCS